jgi:hypothetical protein
MHKEIDSLNGDRILNSSIEDLCDYFETEYSVNLLTLDEDGINVDQNESQIDVSSDRSRHIRDRSRPFYIKGSANHFYIPYSGDKDLLKCRPSTYNHSPPIARVTDSEIILTYEVLEHDAESIKTQFQNDLSKIKSSINCIASDLQGFNSSLRQKARVRIESRKQKILKDRGMVASLGFPMRKRNNTSKTYITSEIRRKPKVQLPKESVDAFYPEPTLEEKEYNHILSVVDNMVLVMERSPQAFKKMKEEDLRQHFLVQLNGHYEGQASGETFNFEGKTDILIRVNGKNIFIAECKIWRGAKSFLDTIDQILKYVSWRDTKTAILLFNRTKSLSSILSQIPTLLSEHSNFKRNLDYKREAGFRSILHHNDDVNREFTLTVHIWKIPGIPDTHSG